MASSNAMGKKKMSESSLASLDDPRFDFAIGDQMLCEWREERRQCEIIERRINSMTQQPQYYVHYAEFNRRLDEWVNRDRLHPLEAASSGKKAAGSGSGKRLKIDPSLTISHLSGPSAHDDATAGELDAATQREHEAATRVKNVNKVVLGKWEMQTWYFSPFPKEYSECDTLYFCEYDLHFCRSRDALIRYQKRKEASGDAQHPPGNEIYRSGEISVFECDGVKCRTYCQNLCLLAKLFLDHKTLYYDVDPFLFYVLCEVDAAGGHKMAGYFSKEKVSAEANNVACILVLPHHQRKGYGKLLIDVAYQITIREGAVGSPEKPLSDLGQLSFRSYWTEVLLRTLQAHRGNLSIKELSAVTAIKMEDIISTLQAINCIRFWKGQHVISVAPKIVDDHLAKHYARASLRCEPARLKWQPPDES